jgi:hypothetical protein
VLRYIKCELRSILVERVYVEQYISERTHTSNTLRLSGKIMVSKNTCVIAPSQMCWFNPMKLSITAQYSGINVDVEIYQVWVKSHID